MQIELGMTVADKITGFEGVVVGIVYYISGYNQALVLPKAKEGGHEYPSSQWIDLQRLSVDKTVDVIRLENEETPGFDKAPLKK